MFGAMLIGSAMLTAAAAATAQQQVRILETSRATCTMRIALPPGTSDRYRVPGDGRGPSALARADRDMFAIPASAMSSRWRGSTTSAGR